MNILVVGATSAIAEAVLRIRAASGDAFHLLARREQFLASIAQDLRVRGASHITCGVLDMARMEDHAQAIDEAWRSLGSVDCVFIAHGTLGDQQRSESSAETAARELLLNGVATCAFLTRIAIRFEESGNGIVAVISSVAADRGRRSNYVYGAAKAMVSTFLAGMRHRFYGSRIRVVDIRPGLIDTPMTAAFPKGLLWSEPARIAPAIVRAIDHGRGVIYVPWFWRPIMFVIRILPESIFARLHI